ncbi:uncharacterized protein [Vulpes vulpes]|uniref:Uncharacterized protein n=1 Tax=Vulpes vulpes TaxID=9627 RepID=A0ABM5B220_VULVU
MGAELCAALAILLPATWCLHLLRWHESHPMLPRGCFGHTQESPPIPGHLEPQTCPHTTDESAPAYSSPLKGAISGGTIALKGVLLSPQDSPRGKVPGNLPADSPKEQRERGLRAWGGSGPTGRAEAGGKAAAVSPEGIRSAPRQGPGPTEDVGGQFLLRLWPTREGVPTSGSADQEPQSGLPDGAEQPADSHTHKTHTKREHKHGCAREMKARAPAPPSAAAGPEPTPRAQHMEAEPTQLQQQEESGWPASRLPHAAPQVWRRRAGRRGFTLLFQTIFFLLEFSLLSCSITPSARPNNCLPQFQSPSHPNPPPTSLPLPLVLFPQLGVSHALSPSPIFSLLFSPFPLFPVTNFYIPQMNETM